MQTISIINHKGGVGKSTIATNLAGYFASKEKKVYLGDFDLQQSSMNWLGLRPEKTNLINPWEIKDGKLQELDNDVDFLIIDSPAGIYGNNMENIVRLSDKIIVPLRPSMFDIMSTQSFLEQLIESINMQEKQIDLCIIPSMVDERTRSAEQLSLFVEKCGLDSPTQIKQAQIYVQLAAHGLTVFDSKLNTFEREIKQWLPLIDWINN